MLQLEDDAVQEHLGEEVVDEHDSRLLHPASWIIVTTAFDRSM
jgi:hypothetical protein